MPVEIFMPKMSDHMEQGEIADWLVNEGDEVEEGQAVVEIVTDKTSAEIEAPASGVLLGIRKGAEKGGVVPVGETIAFIAGKGEEVPELPPLGEAKDIQEDSGGSREGEKRETQPRVEAQKTDGTAGTDSSGKLRVSPAARRRDREAGIDIENVRGTGPDGYITEKDIEQHVQSESGGMPAEWLDLTPFQKATGERLFQSVTTAPQFSVELSADMEKLLSVRQSLMEKIEIETGKRLSITSLLVKIAARALARYPRANASFFKGRIKIFKEINVGVAVGGPMGLAVPVVKDADRKTAGAINAEIKAFEKKAEAMRFSGDDLEGGHFTVSNLGMYGIERFRAIVNPPQGAILAVGKVMKTPVVDSADSIAVRSVIHLTLTVDHRCMDGIQGAELLGIIKLLIEDPGHLF